MNHLFALSLSLFLSLASFAMREVPHLREEQQPDFAVDSDYLKTGNIQHFSARYEGEELKNLAPKLRALDVQGFLAKKHTQLIYYKFAYTLPLKADAVFERNLYGNNDFVLASNSQLSAIKFINTHNALEQQHSFPSVKGLAGMTIYTLEHFEASAKTKGMPSTCLDRIAPLYDKRLGAPRTMVTKTNNSNQKDLLGAMTYASYYPFGDQTLVVSYKFAVLEPGFKLKVALNFGIAQVFFKDESDALIESVRLGRNYLQTTKQDNVSQ